MTELSELYQDQKGENIKVSEEVKLKKKADKKATSELREASMVGLVKRDKLTDITHYDNASEREKQGQRYGQ